MPFALKCVGICIILGTAACICSLPEDLAEAGEEGPWRRYRSKPDHHRDRHRRRLRDHVRLKQSIRENQSGRQEQQERSDQLPVVGARNNSEDEPRHQPQQDGDGWVVYGADDVWVKLVAAVSPAQRNRCLSPPCGEVRTLSQC